MLIPGVLRTCEAVYVQHAEPLAQGEELLKIHLLTHTQISVALHTQRNGLTGSSLICLMRIDTVDTVSGSASARSLA